MRHNRNTFYSELTPLADAIRRVTCAPAAPVLSFEELAADGARVEAAAREKRAAKLARRAARAKKAGQ